MKYTILAVLLAASFTVSAGNDNSNGGCQGNCSGGGDQNSYNQGGTANAGAAAGAVAGAISGSYSGGGDASATGGNAVANGGRSDASANLIGSGNSTNKNDSTAIGVGGAGGSALSLSQGGKGGAGGSATGGVGNGGTASATSGGNSFRGGDVTLNEAAIPDDVTIRQAAPVYLNTAAPSASCVVTGGASLAGILGTVAVNAGKVDEACRVYEAVRINQQADPEAAKRAMCTLEFWALANPKQCAGTPVLFEMSKKAKRAARK